MRLAFLLLVFILIGCGTPHLPSTTAPDQTETGTPGAPPNEPSTPPEPGSPAKPETPKSEICYSKSCFNLIDSRTINSSDYDYRNPYTDSFFPMGFDPNLYSPPARLLPLFKENTNKKISSNFKFGEFLSPRKGDFGILQIKTLNKIQLIRKQAGASITITSGYRSPGYNSSIRGSAKYSRHQYGDGLDFFSKKLSLLELKQLCLKNEASFVQVYKSHIHCDWRLLKQDFYFFDIAPIPLKTKLSIYSKLSNKIKIYARVVNGKISFEAQNIYTEDGGSLTYLWEVTTPEGLVFTSSELKPKINYIPGMYKVSVKVGETLNASQKIIMN